MRIFVSTNFYLRKFSGADLGEILEIEVNEGFTGYDLMDKLNIPKGEVKLYIVNGRSIDPSNLIAENDKIYLFPPLAGG